MTVDHSDGGDGLTFEKGRRPNAVRAVVMRHGQRIVSRWRRTRDAALRNLVVELTRRLSLTEEAGYSYDFDDAYWAEPDNLRLVIAEGLEGLASARLAADEHRAEMFELNGKQTIVMDIDRMYRGAWTLRWVHGRETAR